MQVSFEEVVVIYVAWIESSDYIYPMLFFKSEQHLIIPQI